MQLFQKYMHKIPKKKNLLLRNADNFDAIVLSQERYTAKDHRPEQVGISVKLKHRTYIGIFSAGKRDSAVVSL